MRDALSTRRAVFAVNMLGLFGIFNKKPAAPAARRVEIVTEAPPPSPPPPAPDTTIRSSVRFKGIHEDVNPAASVRPKEMTCVSCDRQFRYFVNASGSKTVCHCPGCGRQYRV